MRTSRASRRDSRSIRLFVSPLPVIRAASALSWLIGKRHGAAEHPLTVLPLLFGNGQGTLQHGKELLLRGRHERVRDLRLLPEDLPIRFGRRLHGVKLPLAHASPPLHREPAKRNE